MGIVMGAGLLEWKTEKTPDPLKHYFCTHRSPQPPGREKTTLSEYVPLFFELLVSHIFTLESNKYSLLVNIFHFLDEKSTSGSKQFPLRIQSIIWQCYLRFSTFKQQINTFSVHFSTFWLKLPLWGASIFHCVFNQ